MEQITNVRQWLGRARTIDREIRALERALAGARDAATRITQNYESDGAQTSKDPHKLDRLAEYADLIREKKEELLAAKHAITAAIYGLEDGRQRTVLLAYYVIGDNLERIAVEQSYSYRHVRRLRKLGEEAVAQVLKGRETCPTMSHDSVV